MKTEAVLSNHMRGLKLAATRIFECLFSQGVLQRD